MTDIRIKLAESDAEIEAVAPVLLELRSQLEKTELIEQVKAQRQAGYQLAYAEADGEPICAAGFIIGTKLAWGKHLYVDDLVTSKRHRAAGVGAKMIEWLKTYAREQGCGQVHLDSGVQRSGAHRFYVRNGFILASHHFSIPDLGEGQ